MKTETAIGLPYMTPGASPGLGKTTQRMVFLFLTPARALAARAWGGLEVDPASEGDRASIHGYEPGAVAARGGVTKVLSGQ